MCFLIAVLTSLCSLCIDAAAVVVVVVVAVVTVWWCMVARTESIINLPSGAAMVFMRSSTHDSDSDSTDSQTCSCCDSQTCTNCYSGGCSDSCSDSYSDSGDHEAVEVVTKEIILHSHKVRLCVWIKIFHAFCYRDCFRSKFLHFKINLGLSSFRPRIFH